MRTSQLPPDSYSNAVNVCVLQKPGDLNKLSQPKHLKDFSLFKGYADPKIAILRSSVAIEHSTKRSSQKKLRRDLSVLFSINYEQKYNHSSPQVQQIIPPISCPSLQGVTAGAHRLWTHRSYKARLPLRVFLMLVNCLAMENSIYVWTRDHRHGCQMAIAGFLEFYVFGPSGLEDYGSATLRCKI